MAASILTKICINCGKFKTSRPSVWAIQVRGRKHWDMKWRSHRRAKVLPIDLPDYEPFRQQNNKTPEEIKEELKKQGRLPPRTFQERPICILSTGGVFEPYVPPEGDGKSSALSLPGTKERLTKAQMKGKSFLQLRKIKQFDEEFDMVKFAEESQEIYVEAHRLLQNVGENKEALFDLVTEHAYPNMTWGLKLKTLRWQFIESLEPPRAVHARTTTLLSKDNMYGQVTIRFHTKQTMALYDRFGRIMYGSDTIPRSCLEYVVFEKHLSNLYGKWRIHDKIIPAWMPPKDGVMRTVRVPEFGPIKKTEPEPDHKERIQDKSIQPELATA